MRTLVAGRRVRRRHRARHAGPGAAHRRRRARHPAHRGRPAGPAPGPGVRLRGRVHRRVCSRTPPPAACSACRRFTKALIGFGIGALGGRLRVSQPLVQVPGLVLLTIAEGLARFALLKLFHFPAPFVERDDLRGPAAGALQRLPRRRAGAGADLVRVDAGAHDVSDPRLGYLGGRMPGRPDPGRRRIMTMAGIACGALLVIVCQLWYLQVLEGGRFQEASDKNRIRIRPIAAPRGILFDRNGLPLVDNRPGLHAVADPARARARPGQARRHAGPARVAAADSLRRPGRRGGQVSPDSILPVRVRRGLTLDDVAKVEEWKLELPGVIVEVEPQRAYPNSRFAAHLLGYVREASDEQLKQGRYRRGDMVGPERPRAAARRVPARQGRRRAYRGGRHGPPDAADPVAPSRIPAPRSSPPSIGGCRRRPSARWRASAGAVVVMDPRNGDVLAMVSTPGLRDRPLHGHDRSRRVAADHPGSRTIRC